MVAFALICIVSGGLTSNAASALPARTSDEGGVKVVVTPRVLNAGAKGWEFDLVMDTHTKPLSENLAQVAVLLDDSGRRYVPAAWEGDPPGGHHRKGVLRFAAPAEMPATIELQIAGVGGVAIRSFRWDLK
jgi:hypothetical protein